MAGTGFKVLGIQYILQEFNRGPYFSAIFIGGDK
jgi:hypothetical protein